MSPSPPPGGAADVEGVRDDAPRLADMEDERLGLVRFKRTASSFPSTAHSAHAGAGASVAASTRTRNSTAVRVRSITGLLPARTRGAVPGTTMDACARCSRPRSPS
jgi:hypothetical protein